MQYQQAFCDQVFPLQKPVTLRAVGYSMWPAILEGTEALIEPVDPERLTEGNLVLIRLLGKLVVHRYWGRVQMGDCSWIITKGDANSGFDEPILPDQVLGQVTALQNSQGRIATERGWLYWYGRLICSSYWLAKLWAWLCRGGLKGQRLLERAESR